MSETRNLNDRILTRRTGIADDDPDAFDDCGCYGLLRGAKERAVMLDLQFQSGNRVAFAYALFERATYDPSAGLALRFYGVEVKLIGRNLDRAGESGTGLLDSLLRHRVPWIREVEELRGWLNAPDATVVTKIEIAAVKGDGRSV